MTMKGQMTPIRNGLDDWNDSFWRCWRDGSKRVHGAAQAGINVDYPGCSSSKLRLSSCAKERQERILSKKIVLYPGAQGGRRFSGIRARANGALAMVALVLLIAFTNVANLLLPSGGTAARVLRYGRH